MKSIFKIFPLIFLSITMMSSNTFSQEVKDVSFEVIGEKIFIYYTLSAPQNDEFEITTVLKRLNDASFSYIPDNLSNNIGEGQYAGNRKSIIWDVSEDEILMFDGEDFYFEVFANKIEASGGIPWYYFVGTAAVGGAVAAAVLLGGEDDKATPTSSNFPSPPVRP